MYYHKDIVVVEMIFSKCEEIFHVNSPWRFHTEMSKGGARDGGHWEVLWNICKDELDPGVGLGLPCVGARVTASNLESKK